MIFKAADERKLVAWVHDRQICFIAKCEEDEVNEMKLLNTGVFSVHILKHQVVGVCNYNWYCHFLIIQLVADIHCLPNFSQSFIFSLLICPSC